MGGVLRETLARALAGAALVLPAPVLAGDWPDPSVIRADNQDLAVSTNGGWAPTIRVLSSPDLHTWSIASSVFRRPPRWARTNFWAPEIARLGRGYAVFYSALPRRPHSWFCLGVATAATPAGPWHDAGRPLRCSRYGSIDPFPVRDERGRLHLVWKEDGNQFHRPTPFFAQRLRADGRRLLGRPKELIRDSRRWEGKVIEAPTIVRSGRWFHLLYSGNRCCTKRCAYAVGVARSRSLLGPWRKRRRPILRGGRGWRCPGHVSVVPDGVGGLTAVFHAYRGGEERLAGRQLLAAPYTIGADGWPRIGDGRPPAYAPGPGVTTFRDEFKGRLALDWEWPLQRSPGIRTGDGLQLTAAKRGRTRLDAGVLSRRTTFVRYTATATLDRAALRGQAMGGLASYRSGFEAIGISAGRRRAVVWQRRKGHFRRLASASVPNAPLVYLRMIARGDQFRFELSAEGVVWLPAGRSMHGPIEESARLALTVGGARLARARFPSVELADG